MAALDVTASLGPERDALLELLRSLGASEWDQPTECPAWTVKGIALHILGDDLSLLSRQRDLATPSVFLYAESRPGMSFRELLDGFNEQWVEATRFMSTRLVIELLRCTGGWTEEFYTAVDLDELNEPVGFFGAPGRPSPYWQVVAREYVERWLHQHQIRRALGRPNLGVEYLAPAAAAGIRGVAGNLPDLGASAGTTIGFEIPDLGNWSLTRADDGWTVADGAGAEPTASLALVAADATTLFSRGYLAAEVPAAFAVEGEVALAARALDVIQLMVGRDKV
jgi:uncharacterized protein (TIGR03083 family)